MKSKFKINDTCYYNNSKGIIKGIYQNQKGFFSYWVKFGYKSSIEDYNEEVLRTPFEYWTYKFDEAMDQLTKIRQQLPIFKTNIIMSIKEKQ